MQGREGGGIEENEMERGKREWTWREGEVGEREGWGKERRDMEGGDMEGGRERKERRDMEGKRGRER